MAARKIKGTKDHPWPDVVKERIRGAMLEKELVKHVLNEREMSKTQVAAALGLLNKVLPNISENKTEHSGSVTVAGVRYSNPDTKL